MSYGFFRFIHEFARATPRLGGGLTGYQWASLACIGLGAWGYHRRKSNSLHREAVGTAKACLIAGALLATVSPANAADDYQAKLDQIREKHGVPGLAVAAIRDGETLFAGVSGFRQTGAPNAVTMNDLWHIGSCTKSMTATLAGVLVDGKVISWEAKITDLLPEFRGKLEKGWENTTLEQLLQNRGGAPSEPPRDAWALAFKGAVRPFSNGSLSWEPCCAKSRRRRPGPPIFIPTRVSRSLAPCWSARPRNLMKNCCARRSSSRSG
jgi:hypothetical protein